MAITHKKVAKRDLNSFRVYREDTDPTSLFFKVSQVPTVLTAGKNAFLIEGSAALHPETEVLVEVIDSLGNTVYCEPVRNYVEGISRLVTIEIYEDTPPGPATITIMGELRTDEFGNPIPQEWVDTYNVKWQTRSVIIPSQLNDTKIRLKEMPEISVREILYPYLEQVNNITRGPDLLINGTPSENLNGWPSGSFELDDSYVLFGKKSVKISPALLTNFVGLAIDNVDGNTGIPILPGMEYICEVYLYSEQDTAIQAAIEFEYYRDVIGTPKHSPRTGFYKIQKGWNKFVLSDIIAPNINLMKLKISWYQEGTPPPPIWINSIRLYTTNNAVMSDVTSTNSQVFLSEKISNKYLIKTTTPFFSSSMIGGKFNALINLNKFTSSIVDVISDTIAEINPGYTSSVTNKIDNFRINNNYIKELLVLDDTGENFAYSAWNKIVATPAPHIPAPNNLGPSVKFTEGPVQIHNFSTVHNPISELELKPEKTPVAISIYAKAAERNILAIGFSYNTGSFYLNTYPYIVSGTLVSSSAQDIIYVMANLNSQQIVYSGSLTLTDKFVSKKIESVGDDWYRISFAVYIEAEVSQSKLSVSLSDSTYSTFYSGSSGSGLYVWGPQLEFNDVASMYNPRRNNVEYSLVPTTIKTTFTRSLAELDISKLETLSGEIARARIFVKNYDLQDNYKLIDDIKLSPTEFLISSPNSNNITDKIYIGNFITSSILNDYWYNGTIINNEYSPVTITSTSIDNSRLIDGMSTYHSHPNSFGDFLHAFESISVWTTESVTVQTNYSSSKFINPMGEYTARKIIPDTNPFTHDLLQRSSPLSPTLNFLTPVPTGSYIYASIYAKKGEKYNIFLGCTDLRAAVISSSTADNFGVILFFDEDKLLPLSASVNSTILSYGAEKQSFGWYKLWMIGRVSSSASMPRLALFAITGSTTSWSFYSSGDNTSGFYVWDAMLFATSSNKIIDTYFGEKRPEISNKIINHSALNASEWITSSIILSSASAYAPDGTISAQRISENNSAQYFYVSNNISIPIVPGSIKKISTYVSQSGRSNGMLYALNNTSSAPAEDNRFGLIFNLKSESISPFSLNSGSVLDYGMKYVGNGWYNVWSIGKLSPLSSSLFLHLRLLDNFQNDLYTGSYDAGMYWWGTSITDWNLESPSLYKLNSEYTLNYNLYCDLSSSISPPISTSVSVYMSGSAFSNSSSLGRLLDKISISPDKLPISLGTRTVNFIPSNDGNGYLNFVFSGNSKVHVSNVSIKSAAEFGFNPKNVLLNTQIVDRKFQHLKFKVELYDNNNNLLPVDLESEPISFDGGNYALLGSNNRIFGTLIASPSGNGVVLGSNQGGSFVGIRSKVGNTNSPSLPQPVNPADLQTYSGSMVITIYSGSSPFIGTRNATGSFGLQVYFSSSSYISIDSTTGIKIMGATITSSSII